MENLGNFPADDRAYMKPGTRKQKLCQRQTWAESIQSHAVAPSYSSLIL